MPNDKGFIKLSRKFFSNKLWNEARTFSSCEAWIDLIQSARFDATPRKESIGGREVVYSRGQYPASIRFLSERWRWNANKVRSFLNHLKKDKMITIECTQGINIITLCKYDEYNENYTANHTDISLCISELKAEVTQLRTQLSTHPPHTGHTNSKKEEEIINIQEEKNKTKKEEVFSTTEISTDIPLPLEECKNKLSNRPIWRSDIIEGRYKRGFRDFNEESLDYWLDIYFHTLSERLVTKKSVSEAATHFSNWIDSQLEKQKLRNASTNTNQRPSPTRNDGEGQITAPESFYF